MVMKVVVMVFGVSIKQFRITVTPLTGWLLLVCLYIVIVYSPCKYVFFMS